jgi:hypothetical protein
VSRLQQWLKVWSVDPRGSARLISSSYCKLKENVLNVHNIYGKRGPVVGRGTMLQAGRSGVLFPMRSLNFSIDVILQAALWPWDRLSL